MKKLKKMLLSLFTTALLFGYAVGVAPTTLEARAMYDFEESLAEKLIDIIVQDVDGKYRLDLEKMKQHELIDIEPNLQRIVNEVNTGAVNDVEQPTIENMFAIGISVGALIAALVAAGLGAVASAIVQFGLVSACKMYGFDMYLKWTRTRGTAEYLFWQFCNANGWL